MKAKQSFVFVALFVFTGCQSTSTNTADSPPRYGNSVQVAQYDNTPRKINPDFEVFGREADVRRPFKIIALVSRNAKPEDEGRMMTAIAWRAKQLGADAMIVLQPSGGGWNYNDFGRFAIGGNREPIFRAHAIIWTAPGGAYSKSDSQGDRKAELNLIGHWESVKVPQISVQSGVQKLMMDFLPDNQVVTTSLAKEPDPNPYLLKGVFSVRSDKLIIYSPGNNPDPAPFSIDGDRLVLSFGSDVAVFQRTK